MRIGLRIAKHNGAVWRAVATAAKTNPQFQFYAEQQPPQVVSIVLLDGEKMDVWLLDQLPDKTVQQPFVFWLTGDESFFWADAPRSFKQYFLRRRLRSKLQKAVIILLPTKLQQQQLINQFGIDEHKIRVAPQVLAPAAAINKDHIKQTYWEGCEVFAALGTDFILALKAFSIFKKRLQSTWKLIWFTQDELAAKQLLLGYKYQSDVLLVPLADAPKFLPAAYALVSVAPRLFWHPAVTTAMIAGVPVIAMKGSAVADSCTQGLLPVTATTPETLGEAMIQLYKNEALHQSLSAAAINEGDSKHLKATTVLVDALATAAPTFVTPKIKI